MSQVFRFRSRYVTLLAVVALILAAFVATRPAVAADSVKLQLDFTGLEDLGSGWAYEGWLIVGGAPVSTGVFTIDGSGAPSATTFTVKGSDASAASAFVLTVEPSPDSDPAPSAVHVLAGDLADGVAQLSAGHGAALGNSFAGASGGYILNAPSGGASAVYANGIWWLDPAAGPGPTLDLPALPAGWVYEGWVVGPGGPMSTGRFISSSGADSDGAGATGGTEPFPPFPGQDFVNPPTVLTNGYAAVISIEPEPDNSAAPFAFKPLVDMVIEDVGAGTLQAMTNNASAFPTGTASFVVELELDFTGLEDLGSGWAYEGWLIVGGAPVSTGVFTIDGSGAPSATTFTVKGSDASAASAFVLTVEPSPDSDPAPSAVHVLAGDLADGVAQLSAGHGAALGNSFAGASGGYILNAPSGGASAVYANGIWWLDPAAGPGPTLDLPALPAGWVYEGWVVGPGGPMSTGRFISSSGADSDGAGATGGTEPFPPFPGQDFVNPPTVLTNGYAAVISIEPEPDNSAAPFAFKPLVDMVIEDVGAGTLQAMTNNASAFPTGTASLVLAKEIEYRIYLPVMLRN